MRFVSRMCPLLPYKHWPTLHDLMQYWFNGIYSIQVGLANPGFPSCLISSCLCWLSVDQLGMLSHVSARQSLKLCSLYDCAVQLGMCCAPLQLLRHISFSYFIQLDVSPGKDNSVHPHPLAKLQWLCTTPLWRDSVASTSLSDCSTAWGNSNLVWGVWTVQIQELPPKQNQTMTHNNGCGLCP